MSRRITDGELAELADVLIGSDDTVLQGLRVVLRRRVDHEEMLPEDHEEFSKLALRCATCLWWFEADEFGPPDGEICTECEEET